MDIDTLRYIERHDPDGQDEEPTEEDYQAFERWVVERYGKETYDSYMRGGWEDGLLRL